MAVIWQYCHITSIALENTYQICFDILNETLYHVVHSNIDIFEKAKLHRYNILHSAISYFICSVMRWLTYFYLVIIRLKSITRDMTHDLHCRTLNSAIVMPRLNLRLTSKELTVLVTRTDTVGLVMTVTLPSILKSLMLLVWSSWKSNALFGIHTAKYRWIEQLSCHGSTESLIFTIMLVAMASQYLHSLTWQDLRFIHCFCQLQISSVTRDTIF